MRFSPARFDRHINNIGQKYTWARAYNCSCVSAASGAPDPKCPLCKGKGMFWDNPIEVVAATANQKTQAAWIAMGMYETGDIVVTIPQNSPMWDAGQYDRVVMLNGEDRFSQPFVRGAPSEKILFTVQRIDRVFWRHPQTNALVEGKIPVIVNGIPSWPDGGEPPPGTSYSLTGWKRSEYFIYMDFPRNRNMHAGMRLPKYVVLRRFDLLGR